MLDVVTEAQLSLFRHGQSAVQAALATGQTYGGKDVPLSELGRKQGSALGCSWVRESRQQPDVVICSELLRAPQTFEAAWAETGWPSIRPLVMSAFNEQNYGPMSHMPEEERLRVYPNYAYLKAQQGYWFYQPPGGDSWEDVAVRLRPGVEAVRAMLAKGLNVWVFGHIVNFQVARYYFEEMSVRDLLAIDIRPIKNANEISYRFKDGKLTLDRLYHRPGEVEALG